MEPLFVVIAFGRGFDSRRLHHIQVLSKEQLGAIGLEIARQLYGRRTVALQIFAPLQQIEHNLAEVGSSDAVRLYPSSSRLQIRRR